MASPGLSPKRQRFVDEYLIDANATQAAVRAGYSKKTANEQAARLLANVSVRAALEVAQGKRAERVKVDQNYVITNLLEIVERCMQRSPILDAAGAETGQWKFDAKGATGAIKLLGVHLGMFNQRGPDAPNDILAGLVRDFVRGDIAAAGAAVCHEAEPTGEVGESRLAAHLADAPAYSAN